MSTFIYNIRPVQIRWGAADLDVDRVTPSTDLNTFHHEGKKNIEKWVHHSDCTVMMIVTGCA
jgi:hypothetical protein